MFLSFLFSYWYQWLSVVTRKEFGKIMIYIAFLFHLVWYKGKFQGVSAPQFRILEGKSCACASVLQNERIGSADWHLLSWSVKAMVRLSVHLRSTQTVELILITRRRRREYFIGDRICGS